ncbi:MAG: phosphoribosyl-AMP cyclohydrolase [Methanothermococcus sp.]|jgi:phosphoribosyl-AMP cyclohydrolase|uniref:phosphoribosyl-AMP cyclohydrolase n=1 Tax=Methanothermococcus TaxID=155862 RepID=UPI00036BF71E|nr:MULTISPECIES: phosphoribosyl-AMP cyclohydrolase [Methanothermococcus]MDK2790032.1 phosphoribosyl-AMP cyclohydrolase [Methanothermococcus sp.]MDK2987082.1 phosphoribosyl-AMP cyclohydrolase [Methanothermococcus sp.]
MEKSNTNELINNLNLKFRNIDGRELITAIVMDENKNILMTAFMNMESLKKTLETKIMHYYSTSRNKIWRKGEESGNTQYVKEVYRDCDGDALLFVVKQKGWACHEDYYSCFHYKLDLESGNLSIVGDKIMKI